MGHGLGLGVEVWKSKFKFLTALFMLILNLIINMPVVLPPRGTNPHRVYLVKHAARNPQYEGHSPKLI